MGCLFFLTVGFASAVGGGPQRRQIPRPPEAIPTVEQLQRSIPRPPEANSTAGQLQRPNLRWGEGFQRRLPRPPGAIPTRPASSRDKSHAAAQLQGPIPRAQGVNPTQSRGESHGGRLQGPIPRGRPTPGANPTRPASSRNTPHANESSRRQIPRLILPREPKRYQATTVDRKITYK